MNESPYSQPAPPIELNMQLAHQSRGSEPTLPNFLGEHRRTPSQNQVNGVTPPSATSNPERPHSESQFLLPEHFQNQTLTQSALSPTFGFSPLPFAGGQTNYPTPGGVSMSNESNHTDPDKDPFLQLLEQLAQNEGVNGQGPSDLGFYLSGQG